MSGRNSFISKFNYVAIFSLIGLLAACGGGSGSGSGSGTPKMSVSGGDSSSGTGGNAGSIDILKFGGVGAVTINSTGTADASFTATTGTPDLGTVGGVITADVTVPLDPASNIASGETYLLTGDTNLYVSDGNNNLADDAVVTGVQINAGVTITLPLNASAGTTAQIIFSDDVDNRGIVTTVDFDPATRGHLEIEANGIFSAAGSSVDTSGTIAGQAGGDITLYTNAATGAVFYNLGGMNSSGADNPGGSGGNAGDISIGAFEALENSGTFAASGGNGGAGTGGSAGFISVITGIDYLFNSGAITASAGTGTTTGGDASGGGIEIVAGTADGTSELRNSGNLTSNGGSGGSASGGTGGSIGLVALGDSVTNSGNVLANGASTDATTGGSGGSIYIVSGSTAANQPAGDVLVSGIISAEGGADSGANTAGSGGDILILSDLSGSYAALDTSVTIPSTAPVITLSGYNQIDANGGAGRTGGNGGLFYTEDWGEDWGGASYVDDAGGSLTNQANINAKGGAVASGATAPADGGSGGAVFLYVDTETTVDGAETVTNSGNLDVSSGGAYGLTTWSSRTGGYFDLYATSDVTNSGNITADGGRDSLAVSGELIGFGHDADGGGGNAVYLADSINGNASNSGTVSARGGDGEIWAGSSLLDTQINGVVITNSGSISTDGGDAYAFGIGGDAGDITFGSNGPSTTGCTLGTLSLAGGAGGVAGSDGTLDTSGCP